VVLLFLPSFLVEEISVLTIAFYLHSTGIEVLESIQRKHYWKDCPTMTNLRSWHSTAEIGGAGHLTLRIAVGANPRDASKLF
jgi:hypothetical protein